MGGACGCISAATAVANGCCALRFTAAAEKWGSAPFRDVGLKDARVEAERWRAVVREGKDPIKERERARREAARGNHSLNEVALDAFESKKAELKGDGEAGRWFSPLEIHVLPKLGKVPVEDIDQNDIRDTLKPIWHSKAVTAKKALTRLGICMLHRGRPWIQRGPSGN